MRPTFALSVRLAAILAAAAVSALPARAGPTETVLYSFPGGPGGSDGAYPTASPIQGDAGVLYGTTLGVPFVGFSSNLKGYGTVYELAPPVGGGTPWVAKSLHVFRNEADGAYPFGGLVRDAGGALYGTTARGGAFGLGTVFRLARPAPGQANWTYTVLHAFGPGRPGRYPGSVLLAAADGTLYGETGASGCNGFSCTDYGVVFALAPPSGGGTGWTKTVLHRFRGDRDGASPFGGLVRDADGALFGTTFLGGGHGTGYGDGTVFRLTPPGPGRTGWTKTTLHRFQGGADGLFPGAGLLAGADGSLYGTTEYGGTLTAPAGIPGYGTVFALKPPAAGETHWAKTVLLAFTDNATVPGVAPNSTLVTNAGGVLYGTTAAVGTNGGTVFRLAPPAEGSTAWRHAALYRFNIGTADGFDPAGVIVGADGALYGTTTRGGTSDQGTVFKLVP